MSQQPSANQDPFAVWRQWLTDSERQWNTYLNEAMSTDQYSQTMGRFMDVSLDFQKSMNESMGRYFSALNIPSRTDILEIGDRLAAIEDRLDAMQIVLERMKPQAGLTAEATGVVPIPRPPRTKRPEVG